MATKHHNISGELTTELLAPGDNVTTASVSLANVHGSQTVSIDLFIQKPLTGKFYLFKNLSLPAGASYVYNPNFSNREGEFGLYIKLKEANTFTLTGSINPTDSSTVVTGTTTLFLTELTVGDEIVVTGETRTVESITNNTTLGINLTFSTSLGTDSDPECNPVGLVDVIIS